MLSVKHTDIKHFTFGWRGLLWSKSREYSNFSINYLHRRDL